MIYANCNNIESLITDNPLTVIQFSASWCMPCKILRSKIEKVETEISDVSFVYCDIEATMDFSQKMKIMSVPTVIAFYNGSEVERFVGGDEKAVRGLVDALRSRATQNP